MIKLFPSILAAVLGEAFAVLAVLCCVCFAALFAKRIPRLRIFRLPRAALAVLGVLALAAVLVSDKPPAGTNVTNRVGAPARTVRRVAAAGADGVTDADVANGWREVSRSTNALDASVFAVPSDGVVWDEARARGARRGYWRLPLAGWGFPGAGFGWTNGFVWAEGMFRPKVESTRDGLVVLDHGLALAPAANWARYGLDASLFWCRTNAVGGLVGTFLGAAVDDDPVKIVNAQFELFPSNGCVALRYDLSRAGEGAFAAGPFENGEGRFVQLATNTSEVVLQRVHPNDWDMDGLPNVLDEDPRVPAVVPTRNQSPDWAARAFPGHAAEIASAGGYLAWAAARGGEADRHLVGLNVESPGGVWPVCLSFGDLQVMCDGTRTLYFPIDDGARYPFALSDGAVLASVEVAGEGTLRGVWQDGYEPYEQHVGGVGLRLDSPRSGWVGRTATVQIAPLVPDHFFPETPRQVSASVTNCHADAYLDCEWRGPPGFSFSNPTSLTTTVEWNGPCAWATNSISLVTRYAGPYEVTNHCFVTVGDQMEPGTEFSVACQDVFFLNDAEILADGSWVNNRPERIRPVSLNLRAARGSGGAVTISSSGVAEAVILRVDENGTTNVVPSGTRINLLVPEDSFSREANETLLLSCPNVGLGEFSVVGELESSHTVHETVSYRVIEPLRELVAKDWNEMPRRLLNPSRLVAGEAATLSVGVRGPFDSDEVVWRVVAGPARPVATNGWQFTVESTAGQGEVIVEARFNNDEIQPRFVLPVVQEQVFDVKMFVTCDEKGIKVAEEDELRHFVNVANAIFRQVGVRFNLLCVETLSDSARYANIHSLYEKEPYLLFFTRTVLSRQVRELLGEYQRMPTYMNSDCIEVYVVDDIKEGFNGFRLPGGIVITAWAPDQVLAHELGHALGLSDCYTSCLVDRYDYRKGFVTLPSERESVSSSLFSSRRRDWGEESGCGFYPSSPLRVGDVYVRFLMYGEEDVRGMNGVDIPDSSVLSVQGNALGATGVGFTSVGVSNMVTNRIEVYTR